MGTRPNYYCLIAQLATKAGHLATCALVANCAVRLCNKVYDKMYNYGWQYGGVLYTCIILSFSFGLGNICLLTCAISTDVGQHSLLNITSYMVQTHCG